MQPAFRFATLGFDALADVREVFNHNRRAAGRKNKRILRQRLRERAPRVLSRFINKAEMWHGSGAQILARGS